MVSNVEFECKLAHQDEVRKVSGFNSLKSLYEKLGQIFNIPTADILFCTVNTHDCRNMDSLLSNYLSFGDLIVIHVCGNGKHLTLRKTQEYLGLTITDNGHGRAFVKRVKSDQEVVEQLIKPGDHIAAINCDSTVGMRHYEVAKALRDLPPNTNFNLLLMEPLRPRTQVDELLLNSKILSKNTPNDLHSDGRSTDASLMTFPDSNNTMNRRSRNESYSCHSKNSISLLGNTTSSSCEDLANTSLPIDQLLSKSSCKDEGIDCHDSYLQIIERINSILESFMGINDNILAIKIYRLAKESKDSFDMFADAIRSSELAMFDFGDDIETKLWKCAINVPK